LELTPGEINIKFQARNEAKREAARRDYNFAVLLLNGRNEPKKFPSFKKFYPEQINEINDRREMRRQAGIIKMPLPLNAS
jgi:hypothetical protein